MNDQRFISILNAVSREHGLNMPLLGDDDSPTGEFLADWAHFLETCVRKGIVLSDPRWQRVTIEANAPHSRFTLEAGGDPSMDADFRVGLQLLMGLLGREDDDA
jgi:hypothetical protein